MVLPFRSAGARVPQIGSHVAAWAVIVELVFLVLDFDPLLVDDILLGLGMSLGSLDLVL